MEKSIIKEFNLENPDEKDYSALLFAFIGDSVYELIIRTVISSGGNIKINKIHNIKNKYVCAKYQAKLITAIKDLLKDNELDIYRRARNSHKISKAKNQNISDYRKATGLEAVVGYLYTTSQNERLLEIIHKGIELLENNE